jgi:hypothetical protein
MLSIRQRICSLISSTGTTFINFLFLILLLTPAGKSKIVNRKYKKPLCFFGSKQRGKKKNYFNIKFV